MPKIRLEVFSQRRRRISDPVEVIHIRGTRTVNPRDIKNIRGGLLLNLVPGTYDYELDLDGFKRFRDRLRIKKAKTVRREVTHRCTLLPTYDQLDEEQKRLFRSFAASRDERAVWKNLSDNQACTFFQITYVLARTPIGDGVLSDYVQRVQRIGGAKILGPSRDGKLRRATGWRMHASIKPRYRQRIVQDLMSFGFNRDAGTAHPTHAKFGFKKSFRQQGPNPRLQVVLNRDASGADVDLDNGIFHRSSPGAVYGGLKRKFPAVHRIYRVR